MFWLFLGAILAAVASNLTAGDASKRVDGKPSDGMSDPMKMLREGGRIESRKMRAKPAGEDIVWEDEENHQTFISLENLALERVWQTVNADGNERLWTVTGTVTEYRGRNYILVERATRAPRSN